MMTIPVSPPSRDGRNRTQPERSSTTRLLQIAESAIRLAALGPSLAELAARVKEQADHQARHAARVAETTEQLARGLKLAVDELRLSASQVGGALETVDRIADQTRMLAINAGIEAARAGEQGRAFAVIVNEVQNLSHQTAHTTQLIETRVEGMRSNIARVAAVASPETAARDGTPTVTTVNRQVRAMAEAATRQLAEADSIHRAGLDINALTEALLLGIGTYRFQVHAHAAAAIERLVPEVGRYLRDRYRLEGVLRDWMDANDPFEVAYVTDDSGRQVTDNFVRTGQSVTRDRAGHGRDWSDRPWFRDALNTHGVHATDIYRSEATQGYCFTVSCALHDDTGRLRGVVGADVSVEKILQG